MDAKRREKYLRIFAPEAQELVGAMTTALLEYEDDPRPELLRDVLRRLHTLKGSSRMINLLEIGDLSHRLEDLYKVLEGEIVPSSVIDLTFRVTDHILVSVGVKEPEAEMQGFEALMEEISRHVREIEVGTDPKEGGGAGGAVPAGEAGATEEFADGSSEGEGGVAPPSDDEVAVVAEVRGDGSVVATPRHEGERDPGGTTGESAEGGEGAPVPRGGLASRFAGHSRRSVAAAPREPSPVAGETSTAAGTNGTASNAVGGEERKPSVLPEGWGDEGFRKRKTPRYPQLKGSTIRVETEKLDRLLDLSGELLIHRSRLEERLRHVDGLLGTGRRRRRDGVRRGQGPEDPLMEGLGSLRQALDRDITDAGYLFQDIQFQSMEIRMLPAASIVDEFYRTVRDLSRRLKKKARLVVSGQETELDKELLEQLKAPLVHMIRNAVDHGIEDPEVRRRAGKPEEGLVSLSIYHRGNRAVFELVDDGGGMDPEQIRKAALSRGVIDEEEAAALGDREALFLVFTPGFSTAKQATDVSGRGIGMDVVKSSLDKVKGNVSVDSEIGEYTRIVLTAPLNLSLMQALLVECAGQQYAIPLFSVAETIKFSPGEINSDGERELVSVHGELLPLVPLEQILGLDSGRSLTLSRGKISAVIVHGRGERLALVVDRALNDDQIVVKSLGTHLRYVPFVSGATIRGEGDPVLILNVHEILEADVGQLHRRSDQLAELAGRSAGERRHVMIVDDSPTTRAMMRSILESAGFRVSEADSAEGVMDTIVALRPELLVSDVDMPGLSGFELTETLRRNGRFVSLRDMPIIIVSSRSTEGDISRGMRAGAQAYIPKGQFAQGKLLETVRALLSIGDGGGRLHGV